ncbi:alcohol dehydrogenase catalytic domain-containing protein [Saccharothrix violaceirubra]|uniref:alcohol dehydrogenase n=1 Tax=Saccharothrix violaceirubra TaxID=413306 RepID=A0A7W7WXS1_9PSEU|nr:zinc-binding dehydrogenase [Saccharothrix violaceirubra]MBB4967442.1 putative phosphonate catabolism associated alcohol dehydrogenase [Saccharothrix violaceirubra]
MLREHARYARWDGVGTPFALVTTPLSEPGPGEVLVRVDLATVCGSDLHTVHGRRPSPVPGVLGHEQVGTVLAVGDDVPACVDGTPVTTGLRVVWSVTASCGSCDRCARGMAQKCRVLRKYGHERWDADAPLTGGFASHCVLVPGTAVMPVPAHVPDEVAAPASCATATVAAVVAAAGPLAGRRVLVTGAGMLGVTAAAMASRSGAHVVVLDPDPGRRAQAIRFGAAETPEAAPVEDVDVALELSGRTEAAQACLGAVTIGGTVVLAGTVSPGAAIGLDPERVVRGLHTIVGVHNYRAADLRTAVDFLAAHDDLPFAGLVSGRFALDRLDDAIAAARTSTAPRQAVVP